MFWDNVPPKFKINSDDIKYTKSVYVCPDCHNDMISSMYQNMIGFNKHRAGILKVIQCDRCFTKFGSHVSSFDVDLLKDVIAAGHHKHFDKYE